MKNLKIGIIALGLLSTTMASAQEGPKCENVFAKMDANADGLVSKAEFLDAKEKAEAKRTEKRKNHKPVDADKKFSKLDANEDGKIDRAEYDKARADHAEKRDKPAKEGKGHFDKMDVDKDGSVSKAEFLAHKEAVKAKRAEKKEAREPMDPEKKFSKLDVNSDGNIDKTEFENACKKKGGKKKRSGKAVK